MTDNRPILVHLNDKPIRDADDLPDDEHEDEQAFEEAPIPTATVPPRFASLLDLPRFEGLPRPETELKCRFNPRRERRLAILRKRVADDSVLTFEDVDTAA